MIRANLRILVLFAAAAVLASPTLAAAPPSSGVTGGQPAEPGSRNPSSKPAQEFQGLGIDRQLTTFAGTVLDIGDHPLSNVLVQLFVDGVLAGTTLTDGTGFYEMKIPYDPHSDTTALLWYVPLDRSLVPKELVIRESKVSQANGLISRCVPRADFTPGRQFRVYLFDPGNRNKDLAELNCLP